MDPCQVVGSSRDSKNNNGDNNAGSKYIYSDTDSKHVYNMNHIR